MELKRKEAGFLLCWAADGLGVGTVVLRLPEHLERVDTVDNKGSIVELQLTSERKKTIKESAFGLVDLRYHSKYLIHTETKYSPSSRRLACRVSQFLSVRHFPTTPLLLAKKGHSLLIISSSCAFVKVASKTFPCCRFRVEAITL